MTRVDRAQDRRVPGESRTERSVRSGGDRPGVVRAPGPLDTVKDVLHIPC